MTDEWPIGYNTELIYFNYNVTDFEKSKEFYQKIFGFKLTYDGGAEIGWCELDLPIKGTKLGLSLVQDKSKFKPGRNCLVLTVDDLEKVKNYLDENNVETTNIVDLTDLVSFFDVFDPDKNRIEFISDPRIKNNKK